jgi:hypothetical protein
VCPCIGFEFGETVRSRTRGAGVEARTTLTHKARSAEHRMRTILLAILTTSTAAAGVDDGGSHLHSKIRGEVPEILSNSRKVETP